MKEIITIEIDAGKSAKTIKELKDLLEKQNKELEGTAKGSKKFEELNKGIKATEKEIKLLTKGVKEYTHSDQARDKAMLKADKTIKQNTESIVRLKLANSNLTAENKLLKKSYDAGEISFQKYSEQVAENTQKIDKNKLEVSNLTAQNKLLLKEQEAIPTSMKEMSLALSKLKNEYKSMTDEERKSPIGQEMLKNINSLDTEIKDLDTSIGNNQRNVGNYPTVMGQAGGAIKNVGGQLMKFAGTLGLVVGAGKLLMGAFDKMKENSQAFGDTIKEVMNGGKEATNAFFRSVANGDWSNLLSNMRTAYEEGKRYAEMLDLIQDKQRAEEYQIKVIDRQIASEKELLYNKLNSKEVRKKALEEIEKLEIQKLNTRQKLIDESIANEEQSLKANHNLTIEEFKKMFGSVEYQQKLHEAQKLEAKMRADEKYISYTQMIVGDQVVRNKHFNEALLQEDIKRLDKATQQAMYYAKKQNTISDEQRDLGMKILGEKEVAEREFNMQMKTLGEQRLNVQNQYLAEEKEKRDKYNEAKQKSIDLALEELQLITEYNLLISKSDEEKYNLKVKQINDTWEFEKKSLKVASKEYTNAERQKNNELLSLKIEYEKSVEDLKQKEYEAGMTFFKNGISEEELLLKQAYANQTEYLGKKITSEEEYQAQLLKIKQAEMLGEMAIMEANGLDIAEKQMEYDNLVADNKIKLNQKVADDTKATIEEEKRLKEEQINEAVALAQGMGDLFAQMMSGADKSIGKFFRHTLAMLLDSIEKRIMMGLISALFESVSSESSKPFPMNIVTSAIKIAAVTAAFGVAKAKLTKVSKAEKGMMVGGKPHSQGGTLIEAERGEAIINKRSVAMFPRELSAINQAGGGVPIMATGGTIGSVVSANETIKAETQIETNRMLVNAIKEMPAPIVMVEEMSNKLVENNYNKSIGII